MVGRKRLLRQCAINLGTHATTTAQVEHGPGRSVGRFAVKGSSFSAVHVLITGRQTVATHLSTTVPRIWISGTIAVILRRQEAARAVLRRSALYAPHTDTHTNLVVIFPIFPV